MSSYHPSPRIHCCMAAYGRQCWMYGGSISSKHKHEPPSQVEVFDQSTKKWRTIETIGAPPVTLTRAAHCLSPSGDMYVYGGFIGKDICGAFYKLSVVTLTWKNLSSAKGPLKKSGSQMVWFGKSKIALYGGVLFKHGLSRSEQKKAALIHLGGGFMLTNEIHIYDTMKSLWYMPQMGGIQPPHNSYFTLTMIDDYRGLVFGGHQSKGRVDKLYLIDLSAMEMTEIKKRKGDNWPCGRDAHSACCLGFKTSHPQLLVVGGIDKFDKTLGDVWIFDLSSEKWREVSLPDGIEIEKRMGHSSVAIDTTESVAEVTIFSGASALIPYTEDTYFPMISETMVLKFKVKSGEWVIANEKEETLSTSHTKTKSTTCLGNLELQALQVILSENIIMDLKKEGLHFEHLDETCITIEDIQYHLKRKGYIREAQQLKSELQSRIMRTKFLEEALSSGFSVPLNYLKFLFIGPPRAGKTTLLKRLIGEIVGISTSTVEPSTAVAQLHNAMIKVDPNLDMLDLKAALISGSHWCSINNDGMDDLDEEALMMYRFINDSSRNSLSTEIDSNTSDGSVEVRTEPSLQPSDQFGPISKIMPTGMDTNNDDNALASAVEQTLESTLQDIDTIDPEIELMFKNWDSLLIRHKYDEIRLIFNRSMLVNMIDMGGQPPFLDMLPALTIGPALYLVCFNLQNVLSKRYDVKYVTESREEHTLQYSYSVLEVLFQSLSSIACLCPADDQPRPLNVIPPSSQAAIIIGTHKDKVSEADIEQKDAEIQKELEKILEFEFLDEQPYHRFLSTRNGKLIVSVDNTGGVDEVTEHRILIEEIIKEKFHDCSQFPIPASWLMFSIFLRKIGKEVLTLKQCQLIAGRLHISSDHTKHVLWFLHYHVGIVMYYSKSEVEGLADDVILCQPQTIFASVSELILNVFLPERCPNDHVRNHFWNFGQFRLNDVKKAFRNSKGLSVDQLIVILQHVNVLIMLKKDLFFMPSVLKTLSDVELDKTGIKESIICPIRIKFRCIFVPVGCFSSMVAMLVKLTKENQSWQLKMDAKIYKNMVSFQVEGSYVVTLVARLKCYEIHLNSIPEAKYSRAIELVATDVVKETCFALDTVLKRLKRQYVSSPDLTMYQLGFSCTQTVCKRHERQTDHLMLFEPGVREITSSSLVKCAVSGISAELQPSQLLWGGQSLVGHIDHSLTSKSDEYSTITSCTGDLRLAVQPHLLSLGARLIETNLITPDHESELRNEMHTEAIRAARLVELVQLKVKLNPDNYHTFLSILIDPRYRDILDILNKHIP